MKPEAHTENNGYQLVISHRGTSDNLHRSIWLGSRIKKSYTLSKFGVWIFNHVTEKFVLGYYTNDYEDALKTYKARLMKLIN